MQHAYVTTCIFLCVHLYVWMSLCAFCACFCVFMHVCPSSLSVPGYRGECVPWEGPAGCVPHQGQQGPGGVPAGHGALHRESHWGAGWHPAQPLQKVRREQGARQQVKGFQVSVFDKKYLLSYCFVLRLPSVCNFSSYLQF